MDAWSLKSPPSTFIHNVERRVFDNHEGLPNYEWNEKVKTSILQNDPKFKGSSCQRNEHLVYLYNHLEGCDKFFWHVNRVIKTVAAEKLRDMDVEVVDMLQLLNRVRLLENEHGNLKYRQGEVNNALDLHEVELVNNATNTFIDRQNEVDKELILRRMPFVKNENMRQCRTRTNEWLNKNCIRNHCNVYAINVEKRSFRVTFNSD